MTTTRKGTPASPVFSADVGDTTLNTANQYLQSRMVAWQEAINDLLITNNTLLKSINESLGGGGEGFVIPGRKDSLSTTVLDDITQIPGTTVVPNPGGIQCEVVSSSVDDDGDPGGTGIRTLEIHYLDTSGIEQSETVIMDGTTPVNTVATDIDKVQWMHAKSVGSGGVASGNISLRDTAGITIYEYIAAGGNQSLSCRVHVPTGKKARIVGWHASAITKNIDFRLRADRERFDGALIPGVFLFQDAVVLEASPSGFLPIEPTIDVPAGATIKVSGISSAAGGDAGASIQVVFEDV